ncbi:MAG: DMT family transporter [Thermoleophilia bacterium]
MAMVLALGAAMAWGFADFKGGIASRQRAVLAVLVVSQAAGAVFMLALAAGFAGNISTTAVVAGIAGGVLGAGSIAAFYAALAGGSMGVVAPITATNAVLPVIVGFAAGERPHPLQLAGLGVTAIGVVLAAREPGGGGHNHRRSVMLALVAAVLLGATLVMYHRGAESSMLWTITVGRLTSFAVLLGAAAVLRPSLRMGARAAGGLAMVGILDVGANALFAASATMGYLSVAGVLASLYPVVTVALARTRLHEHVSAPQQAGVALSLSGLALIGAG